jgi:hypothetical protein
MDTLLGASTEATAEFQVEVEGRVIGVRFCSEGVGKRGGDLNFVRAFEMIPG